MWVILTSRKSDIHIAICQSVDLRVYIDACVDYFEARVCNWWLWGYFLRWCALLTFCLVAGYKNYFSIFQVNSVLIGINTDQLLFDKVFLMETKWVKAWLFLHVNRILHKESKRKGAYNKKWNAQREDSNANNLLKNPIRISKILWEWTNLWFHSLLF